MKRILHEFNRSKSTRISVKVILECWVSKVHNQAMRMNNELKQDISVEALFHRALVDSFKALHRLQRDDIVLKEIVYQNAST